MMDKIKLKNEMMWNCMNNEEIEFVEEDLNTNTMMEDILELT